MAIAVFEIALTTHQDATQSSNQVPTVILDEGIHEYYMLATEELSQTIIFPTQGCATVLNSVHQ